MHQISISAAARPQTPLGELTALPQTPYLDLSSPTSNGREGSGKEKGRGGDKVEKGLEPPPLQISG